LAALLNRPPGPGHPDQLGEGGPGRGVAGEERQLALTLGVGGQGTADQQVTVRAGGGDQRPVIEPRSLSARAAGDLLPPGGGHQLRELPRARLREPARDPREYLIEPRPPSGKV
jgi:hypothetical protein